ncbi:MULTISPECIES: DUF397 domain-containing protein [Actinosynnema]|uniref:DUF397 domain-containing protein n=1 Tax=Actinosynnema TaxID=40566 RepID=UPI0020A35A33|nr:DUF397 domain-containing protein [Actinosynnema pretiosum]MCP2099070.1 protein of unknown function (DUF397) [Actinosynnema pretiosum]
MTWRKSSYSTGTGNCVEIALTAHTTHVRDSKNPHAGAIAIPAPAWAEFLRATKAR